MLHLDIDPADILQDMESDEMAESDEGVLVDVGNTVADLGEDPLEDMVGTRADLGRQALIARHHFTALQDDHGGHGEERDVEDGDECIHYLAFEDLHPVETADGGLLAELEHGG